MNCINKDCPCGLWGIRYRYYCQAMQDVYAFHFDDCKAYIPEQDLTKCPKCGGPADNGFDRCYPPNAYYCSKCEAENDHLTGTYRATSTDKEDLPIGDLPDPWEAIHIENVIDAMIDRIDQIAKWCNERSE